MAKKEPREPETYTEQEMRDFVAKWEKNHSLGRGRYSLRLASFVGLGYVVLLGFIYPLMQTGTLDYLNSPNFYATFILPFGVAVACAYYAGYVIFTDNDKKYRIFETMVERYSSAWDWILEEKQQKQQQKSQSKGKRGKKGN